MARWAKEAATSSPRVDSESTQCSNLLPGAIERGDDRATPRLGVRYSLVDACAMDYTENNLDKLYQLALKRFEEAERDYDTFNVRAAGLLGFSSFLLPNMLATLGRIEQSHMRLGALGAFTIFFGVLALSSLMTLRLGEFKSLPRAEILLANRRMQFDLREELIRGISEMAEQNEATNRRKAWWFERALYSLMVVVAILIVTTLVDHFT